MKYIERVNQTALFSAFESHFVTAVLGPRQIGKSTLVTHYIEAHPDHCWVFLNMDFLLERDRVVLGELDRLIEEKAQQRIGYSPAIWVFIEEAQKCPELFDQIKIIKCYQGLFLVLHHMHFLILLMPLIFQESREMPIRGLFMKY